MADAAAGELFQRFSRVLAEGCSDLDRRRRLMLEIGRALSERGGVPRELRELEQSVVDAWHSSETPDASLLLRAKLTLWEALDAKNGGCSTAVRDAADRAMRAALCLTELVAEERFIDTAGWAAEMLSTEPWPRPTNHF
ncbi:MAG TPA: hypothetical protein VNS46_10525 [Nocardioides sp.]|nr:hypothetical protein [Nocardioides sp.]